MLELTFEGFESALLPCSLILLLPGVAVAIAARQEATPAILGFGFGSLLVSWLRFSGRLDDPPASLLALGFVGAVILLLVPLIRRLDVVSAAGGALAGAAAAGLWLPCVGIEFGTLLGELPGRGPSGIFFLGLYLFGVLSPLIIIATVMHLIPELVMLPARPLMMVAGGGVLGVLAVAVAAGMDDELVSKLVEWSL